MILIKRFNLRSHKNYKKINKTRLNLYNNINKIFLIL